MDKKYFNINYNINVITIIKQATIQSLLRHCNIQKKEEYSNKAIFFNQHFCTSIIYLFRRFSTNRYYWSVFLPRVHIEPREKLNILRNVELLPRDWKSGEIRKIAITEKYNFAMLQVILNAIYIGEILDPSSFANRPSGIFSLEDKLLSFFFKQ